jgi:ankyrin repeat protein
VILVKKLLNIKGVDINIKNKYGENALLNAIRLRNKSIVSILLSQPNIKLNVINNNIQEIKTDIKELKQR